MRYDRSVTSIFASDPAAMAAFFVEHLGFEAQLDIGWFMSLVQPDHPDWEVAITAADHESVPPSHRHAVRGTAIAVVVEDAHAVHADLVAAGVPPLAEPVDHPWGQRQFFAPAPDGLLLDVLQLIPPDPDWLAEHGLAG
ncbi:MAG: VOC family protein [Actinomycetota bacterium]